MPDDELAAIERRLDDGEWLRPGEVAALFGTTRTSIHRWLRAGRIRHRRRGPRQDRFLNPEDVRRELDEYRRERRNGEHNEPAPPAT
ncbi:MAG TPA: helix-turn-helix domain-containing protein [Propionibacteriaceae bacterium]|nr:helix-turn-helix domain-containing protein [Propionibacteriaceae bacterium]